MDKVSDDRVEKACQLAAPELEADADGASGGAMAKPGGGASP